MKATGRRQLLRLGGAMLAGGAAGGAAWGQDAPAPRVRWPAELPLLDGRRLPAAALEGKAVVAVFFATDCPFCVRHMTHVQRLAELARDRALTVLCVAHDTDAEVVRRHLAQHGWRLPVTLEQAALHAVLSPRRVVPLTCVVGRDGRLREVIAGEMFEEDVLRLARWADAPAARAGVAQEG